MNIRTFVAILSRKAQHDFPKMRGGVKGRLELFRKFIRFGGAICPLQRSYHKHHGCHANWLDRHDLTFVSKPLFAFLTEASQISNEVSFHRALKLCH